MADETRIAVLGAGGIMGFAMAGNLAGAGFEVRAWNRSRDKAEPLVRDGAEVCDSPAEAAKEADVVLTMLSDTVAVLDLMQDENGPLTLTADDALWLQMSTLGERGTEQCIELAERSGIEFVDAPVLGTKQPAQEGKLVILGSGPERLRSRVQPIFDAVGQRTMWIGEAGAGTRLKVAINSWILAVVEAGAETFALAEALGLDPKLVLEALEGGPLDLPYLRMKGQAIMARNFEPSFRLELAAKDAGLVDEAASRRHMDLPLVSTVRRRLEQGAQEHGDEDMSATYLTSARG